MASPLPCRPKPVPCSLESPPQRSLQVKVVGLFKSSSFQVAKIMAEVTGEKLHVWPGREDGARLACSPVLAGAMRTGPAGRARSAESPRGA
jgi:hypothetical protein